MKATKLSSAIQQAILKDIPATNKTAIRLVEYLAEHPNAVTVDVNKYAVLGNISDVARKINPTLYRHGYLISCQRPVVPIPNRFGDKTNMFLWGIYKLPNDGKAANDSTASEQAS